MASIQVKQTYSDFSMSFTPHPVTGDLLLLKGADAIKQSVKILVLTNFYEIPFEPYRGGNVTYHQFETDVDDITASKVKADITRVITNYERRATELVVVVKADQDRNGFAASITFTPINLTDPVTVDLFLKRVR